MWPHFGPIWNSAQSRKNNFSTLKCASLTGFEKFSCGWAHITIENIDNCTNFDEKFLEVLDKHAPLKKNNEGKSCVTCFEGFTKSNNEEILTRKSVL